MKYTLFLFMNFYFVITFICYANNSQYNEYEKEVIKNFYIHPKINKNVLIKNLKYIFNYNLNNLNGSIIVSGTVNDDTKPKFHIYNKEGQLIKSLNKKGWNPVWYNNNNFIYKKNAFKTGRQINIYNININEDTVLVNVLRPKNQRGGNSWFIPWYSLVISRDKKYLAFTDGFCNADGGGEEIVLVYIKTKRHIRIFKGESAYLYGFTKDSLFYNSKGKIFKHHIRKYKTKKSSLDNINVPISNSEISHSGTYMLIIKTSGRPIGPYIKSTVYLYNLKDKTNLKLLDFLDNQRHKPIWIGKKNKFILCNEGKLEVIDCSKILE